MEAERAGKSAIAPKQRKTTQELDERTKARHSATYIVGKGEAMAIRESCMRSCVTDQGPQTTITTSKQSHSR
jgi:hypothetical protein